MKEYKKKEMVLKLEQAKEASKHKMELQSEKNHHAMKEQKINLQQKAADSKKERASATTTKK